jgi:hypothetical protein
MTLLALSGLVLVLGAVGGAIHSLMPDTTVPDAPHKGPFEILRNIALGAVAAWVSWGVYGPFASSGFTGTASFELSLSAAAGALLVGIAGSRWLAKEVENKIQKTLIRDQMNANSDFQKSIKSKYPRLRL